MAYAIIALIIVAGFIVSGALLYRWHRRKLAGARTAGRQDRADDEAERRTGLEAELDRVDAQADRERDQSTADAIAAGEREKSRDPLDGAADLLDRRGS